MQQEELARLFEQNLNFAPPPSNPTPPPEPISLSPPEEPKRASSEPITYISTHYTHSAHLARPREASPPLSTSSHLERSDLEQVLISQSIDPGVLFPSQLTLFQNADPDQRLRLLELWRISPPTYAQHERIWESGLWPETSLQQEEALAKERYERLMGARQAHHHVADGIMYNETSSPQPPKSAEPYMQSGYEALARREYEASVAHTGMPLQETTRYNLATDPAYMKAGQQDMENQYGAFQAMRQAEVITPMDEDMVM